MIQNIGLTDEALSGYTPQILKYLEGEVRLKCSNTRRRRQIAELLYAYRLNFATVRDLDLSKIIVNNLILCYAFILRTLKLLIPMLSHSIQQP